LNIDYEGSFLVTERGRHRIIKIGRSGEVSIYAGNGEKGYKNGPALSALFSNPGFMAVDRAGSLFVADSGNHVIRKISRDGIVSTVAGNGKRGYSDGDPFSTEFAEPYGIAIDWEGNLIITEIANNVIRKIIGVAEQSDELAKSLIKLLDSGIQSRFQVTVLGKEFHLHRELLSIRGTALHHL